MSLQGQQLKKDYCAGKERQISHNWGSNLNIIPRRDKLAGKGSKVKNIVENFCKEDETNKFIRQKSLDWNKHIEKNGIYLNNFGIIQIGIMANIWIFKTH